MRERIVSERKPRLESFIETSTRFVDSISTLDLNLANSNYTGAIHGEGSVSVTMDAASTWTLTGDSYITSLSGDLSGLDLNGYTLYVNGAVWTA